MHGALPRKASEFPWEFWQLGSLSRWAGRGGWVSARCWLRFDGLQVSVWVILQVVIRNVHLPRSIIASEDLDRE